MDDLKSRRLPSIPWSPAVGYIRLPDKHSRWEMIIAFFYPDSDRLMVDYERSAAWRKLPDVRAATHTASLEKTPDGQAWIDFGPRYYRTNPIGATPTRDFIEPPGSRVAVKIHRGGSSRAKVKSVIPALLEINLIFNVYDAKDPGGLKKLYHFAKQDCIGYLPGTNPIKLSGLATLGCFTPIMTPDVLCKVLEPGARCAYDLFSLRD